MKYFFAITFLFPVKMIFSQIGVEYGCPVKWTILGIGIDHIRLGIDTLTRDTLKITRTHFYRINSTGDTLADLIFNESIDNLSCSDDGYFLTGIWTKWFPNHDVEESGLYVCNQKIGEWFYFYKKNKIKKYENYFQTSLQEGPRLYGFLNGLYKEYYENGKTKITGTYKIVQEYASFLNFNPDTYEDDEKCCAWKITSVKYGDWIEYNQKGKVISRKYYHDKVGKKNFRDLTDTYNFKDLEKY